MIPTGLTLAKRYGVSGGGGTSPGTPRPGLVHGNGLRTFGDDAGWFFPLGTSIMWALNGYKFERDRVMQNVGYAASKGCDFARIFASILWPAAPIDPQWFDFDAIFTGYVDASYEQGVRSMVTLFGGSVADVGGNRDPLEFTRRIARLYRGREHKILYTEVVNEGLTRNSGFDEALVRDVMRTFQQEQPHMLIAGTSPPKGDVSAVNSMMRDGVGNVAVGHFDRSDGDWTDGMSWREVRQTWDWAPLTYLSVHQEPKGPHSSVAQQTNPIVLAMMRANAVNNGVGAFVLHTGAGVLGHPDPVHSDRPSNLWEETNIDACFAAVKAVDTCLPEDLCDWSKHNGQWQSNPCKPDMFWGSPGADHGCVRCYVSQKDRQFVAMPHGILQYVDMTPDYACHIDVYSPLNGEVIISADLGAHQSFRLGGPERGGLGAYIVRGR